ncbi:MAG TPA: glycosyltransferase [Bryobacteraceae bacterium]|nr:glycosyltransferase [Bryobacteraceae bacterium]
MKVCIVSNIFPPHVRGGYELGCESIAEQLVRDGHRVDVVTSAVVGKLDKARPNTILNVHQIFEPVFEYEDSLNRVAGQSPLWLQRRRQAFGGVIPSNALALARFLEAHTPDVVWIFNPLGLGPIGILESAQTTGARCVIHLMDHIDTVISHHQGPEFPYYAARWRRVKASVSAISCSRKILTANSSLGRYRSHRVIYNGVDFAAIPNRPRASIKGCVRFVYFGQVEEVKGVRHIAEAAARLRREAANVEFEIDIIGRGSEEFRLNLQQFIEANALHRVVRLRGFVPRNEMLDTLCEYDAALMLLSDLEPFAYAPIEAAAAGLPVVQTLGSGNAESLPAGYPLGVADRSDYGHVAERLKWCIENRASLPAIAADLRRHQQALCDFHTVSMPSYLRVLRAARPASTAFSTSDLIAADMTARGYALLA